MKKILTICALALFLSPIISFGQAAKVNEACSKKKPCAQGLNCVTLKDGKKKCARCTQATLNDLSKKADEKCKMFGPAWTPETDPYYLQAVASDGRVSLATFDQMSANAKQCKDARMVREQKCWNPDGSSHQKDMDEIAAIMDKIAAFKTKMVSEKRVYYSSESSYKSLLKTYTEKCQLNFNDINQKLVQWKSAYDKGEKSDCKEIIQIDDQCQACAGAAKFLLNDGFSTTSKFPDEYTKELAKAEEAYKKATQLLQAVKGKNLCN